MEFNIENVSERKTAAASKNRPSDLGSFKNELDRAVGSRADLRGNTADPLKEYFGAFTVVSPKIREKLLGDPEYSVQLSQKIEELLRSQGESIKNCVVIVDREGGISQHCFSSKREERHPTAEELKAVARARARKKARLDAYFHLLERISIKRKLVEQENAKRLTNKKFRFTVSGLDITARSRQLTAPPVNPDYFF